MTETLRVTYALLTDAALFCGIAVAVAFISLFASPERRKGIVGFAALALAMLAGLALLGEHGAKLGSGTAYDIAREALLALLALGVIRAVVLFAARIVLFRMLVPKILIDVVFALGMIAYGIYRLDATGFNLASVVTTSAIVTGALAFSAGEALANLWAGLSLQLENTLRIGDWVRFEDRIGQVASIRWRSMAIATETNETIVVPNSRLMKERVVVLGRFGERPAPLRRAVPFRVDYDYSPAKVIEVITAALQRAGIANVADSPPPTCVCRAFEDSGVLYSAVYHPLDLGQLLKTDSQVLVRIYTALLREGMPIPLPQQVVELRRRSRERAASDRVAREAIVNRLELFNVLNDQERASLAGTLQPAPFAAGELIFRKGDPANSLYVLAEGSVLVMEEDAHGRRMELATLTAPDYFGEMGLLTGQPRRATLVAASDSVCYRLGKEAFDAILKSRPAIAEALAPVVATRQAENAAKLHVLDEEARARHFRSGTRDLLQRIRQFFALPH